jgi:hypothetical protein
LSRWNREPNESQRLEARRLSMKPLDTAHMVRMSVENDDTSETFIFLPIQIEMRSPRAESNRTSSCPVDMSKLSPLWKERPVKERRTSRWLRKLGLKRWSIK